MFRLDKNEHKTYNLKETNRESANYAHMSLEEKINVFLYLQSVAYNYEFNSPPRMDKNIHSYR